MSEQWVKTACVLCSVNCGPEVKVEVRTIARVRGNKEHAASEHRDWIAEMPFHKRVPARIGAIA